MKVEFTRPAQAGLRGIAHYIAKGNPVRAQVFRARIASQGAGYGKYATPISGHDAI